MKTVLSVFGTRPEAIKMAPLALELQRAEGIRALVCVTGQHREMLDDVMTRFGVTPDYDLNIMQPRQTLTTITVKTLSGLDEVLDAAKPDLTLVHGDTSTTFSAALAAFYKQIPVGHVEAGLRTGDRYSPYPEELNRQLTGRLSTLHFCPTERNRENLRAEGISEHVYVTGNTVIDALRYTVRDGYAFESPDLQALPEGELILVTAHRRENLGEPMRDICGAILDLLDAHRDAHVVLPMHKSPAVREILVPLLGSHPRVRLIEPVGVYDLHNLMNRCKLVLTDSGGLQEEAPALGKPVLVLRRETERPEAVEAGTVKLAGVNRAEVFALAHELLSDARAYEQMAQARNPYGDGHTSERISAAIQGYFAGVSG